MKNANSYDLCVIGCGVAGFAAAMSAVDYGKNVCVVEGDEIGGTGVMWGALASKTMWELSKDYAVASKTDRGFYADQLRVEYQAVRKTVLEAVKEKQTQMLHQIEAYAPSQWQGPGTITYKRGWGAFASSNELVVTYPDNTSEPITAGYFIIATGSKPQRFPHIEIDQRRIFDTDGFLNLKSFPRRLMIIGAGITGCEFATIFSNFKRTHVILVDNQQRILPFEDEDISHFVGNNLEQNGVTIHHSASLKNILKTPEALEVLLDFDNATAKRIEVDAVLISIGRRPNFTCLRLDNAGIQPNANGILDTDGHCLVDTCIYAAGDVTHYPALVNMADLEGRYAVRQMFEKNTPPLNYRNLSTIMFFYPPVAAVGFNERICQQKKIPYRVAYYANAMLTRNIAMRSTNGFVKIIASDDDTQKILGMRAAGPQVSGTIMSITLLMDQGKSIQDALNSIYPHPTISEGIQECMRMLLGKSSFKAHTFPEHMRIRRWHPDTGYHS